MKTSKPILLYDGECNFCNFWVGLIQRQKAQSKFRYFSLGSPTGKELLAKKKVNNSIDSVLVVDQDKVFAKSEAAFKIAKTLGGWWHLARVFWIIPAPVRNWMYDVIAKNRHRFFKNRTNCEIHS